MRFSRGTASVRQAHPNQHSTFLQYILHVLGLLICISQAIPSSMPIDNGVESIFSRALKGSSALREVNLLSFSFDTRRPNAKGVSTFPDHTALVIAGTKADPSIHIEIIIDGNATTWRCRIVHNERKVAANQKKISQGTTSLTNEQIIYKDGTGPAWKALIQDLEYYSGPIK